MIAAFFPGDDMQPDQHEAGLDYLVNGGLGQLTTAVRNAILARLEVELAPLELTSAQFVVVIGAMRGKARTVNEFCAFAGTDAGSMSRLLDRLEAKGIVRRTRAGLDRRQVQVVLTEKGQALSPLIMPAIARVNQQFLAGFSSDDAVQLQTLLQRMLANNAALR
jgi:DNA-binding MarR family transcriptional regulator